MQPKTVIIKGKRLNVPKKSYDELVCSLISLPAGTQFYKTPSASSAISGTLLFSCENCFVAWIHAKKTQTPEKRKTNQAHNLIPIPI